MKKEIFYYFMRERIKKVNQVVRKELFQIIIREVEFPVNVYVTLTRVETSVNLRQARIYVSVMPENRTREVLNILKSQIYGLQQKLNKRLFMRPVPKIFFVEEKETAKAGKVEEILEKLKKENGQVSK